MFSLPNILGLSLLYLRQWCISCKFGSTGVSCKFGQQVTWSQEVPLVCNNVGHFMRQNYLLSDRFKMIEILLFVGIVSGQGRIPLHSLMTEDELRLYFGDQVQMSSSGWWVEAEFPFTDGSWDSWELRPWDDQEGVFKKIFALDLRLNLIQPQMKIDPISDGHQRSGGSEDTSQHWERSEHFLFDIHQPCH